MNRRRVSRPAGVAVLAAGLLWACGFDETLREYLNANFWLPLAKNGLDFGASGRRQKLKPYAGIAEAGGKAPLDRLRAAYQEVAFPGEHPELEARMKPLIEAARADARLSAREREEVELIEAKAALRSADADEPQSLGAAQAKLQKFVASARTPEFLSEARGWLAHIHYQRGERAAAGKIYLDELGRRDSNLSGQTLANSLKLLYGYDGGDKLLEDLEDYFDTAEHAAFAITLATNPRFDRLDWSSSTEPGETRAIPYRRITELLEKHGKLFRTAKGANTLALVGMRTALRAGDPKAAVKIAAKTPDGAAVRSDPDFLWMSGSARFLTRDYAGAEAPLAALFASRRASMNQKSAAAYGLCGVYQKLGNAVEQIRYALWLYAQNRKLNRYLSAPSAIEDQSVYWAVSGWDLGLLLDIEAPVEALREFAEKYPAAAELNLVRYSLAVRVAREDRFEEAAQLYELAGAAKRAVRMRQLAAMQADNSAEGRFQLAEFIGSNSERVYFNDRLWGGLQRYAMFASRDTRTSKAERKRLMAFERELKDRQEERWQAHLKLRELMKETGRNALGRRSANLALQFLAGIRTDRFQREAEVEGARREVRRWLYNTGQ